MTNALKVLILGGSGESLAVARALHGDARFDAVLSLAGRTAHPEGEGISLRRGGFGGAEGLAKVLRDETIDVLVDATHPFADTMKSNAVEAARLAGVQLLSLRRPQWSPQEGDHWIDVADMDAAVAALGNEPRRVFLSIGRQEVGAFKAAPQHSYLVRGVDRPAPADLPPQAEVILARGPFDLEGERALLVQHRIERLVSKNSGGSATEAKLAAARELRLPVVMVRRPLLPEVEPSACVETPDQALHWLELHHANAFSTLRGV